MSTRRRTRSFAIILGLIALALTVIVLTGCGGGSSGSSVTGPTASGGQSTAVVQGQVVTTQRAAIQAPVVLVLLRNAIGIGLAEAAPGDVPLAGATVKISSPTFTAIAITDGNGNFTIPNVPPGVYSVEVNGLPLAGTSIEVGGGDQVTLIGRVTQNTITGTVTVVAIDSGMNDTQLGHAINIDNGSAKCDLFDVVERRQQRLGWGVIARQCEVHPGVLGLGRSNLSDAEIADARDRIGRGRGRGGPQGHPGKSKA